MITFKEYLQENMLDGLEKYLKISPKDIKTKHIILSPPKQLQIPGTDKFHVLKQATKYKILSTSKDDKGDHILSIQDISSGNDPYDTRSPYYGSKYIIKGDDVDTFLKTPPGEAENSDSGPMLPQ